MFPPLLTDPVFLAISIPAILMAGISKGGMGGALGMLGVPAMALVISPTLAAAIMLPILCCMDIFGVLAYRKKASFPHLKIMLPAACLGIVIGTLTYNWMNDDFIRLLIGLLCIGFTLNTFVKNRLQKYQTQRIANTSSPSIRPISATIWSCFSGFTSFVTHAGGPPLQIYLLPQKLDKTIFVGTTVWYFLIVNYVKLIPYGYLGLLQTDTLYLSLILLPLAPLGIWLGVKLHKIVPQSLFYRISFIFLFFTGLKLCWDGIKPYVIG